MTAGTIVVLGFEMSTYVALAAVAVVVVLLAAILLFRASAPQAPKQKTASGGAADAPRTSSNPATDGARGSTIRHRSTKEN